MPTAAGPNTKGEENLVFSYDLGDVSNSYKGEPTQNLIPNPSINARFGPGNGWRTYNTAQYNSNTYFSIGTIKSVIGNVVTLATIDRPIYTFDVLRAQTSGGGINAGTDYYVKKLSDNQFTLHAYNGSQDGTQGYIDPSTGMHKVHESIALDQRINVSFEEFPTVWWGPPHTANMCYVKELRYSGGPNDNSNFMRIHQTRLQALNGGMAYGVYPSVTQGDIVTFSFWAKSNVVRNFSWSAYFGGGFQGASGTIQATKEWQRFEYTWTASNTFGFYIYFWPSSPGSLPYFVDLADLQVEVNKGHATPFTLSSRSATQGLLDLTGNSTIDLSNVSFDSNAQMTFDGTNDYAPISFSPSVPLYTLETVFYNINTIPNNDSAIGGPTSYQTMFWFNQDSPMGVSLGGWTSSATNEAIHIWSSPSAPYYLTHTRDAVPSGYHHLVFSWNGSYYDIYLNGEKQTIYAGNNGHARLITLSNLTVGGDTASDYHFNGNIDIVKLYSRGLSASEIKSNFNAIKGRFNI
jgi:hypothetical protein